jgi:hypothetical protein
MLIAVVTYVLSKEQDESLRKWQDQITINSWCLVLRVGPNSIYTQYICVFVNLQINRVMLDCVTACSWSHI